MTHLPARIARFLTRGVGLIAVAVAAQSAGNLIFHAVVGRLLEPGSYGALGAVLAAMVMLGVPLGALQTAASALAAEHGLSGDTARRALRPVALWSLAPAAVVLLAAPLLRDYFHLGSLLDAAQLAPYLVLAAVLATARGLLLGDHQGRTVAVTYLVATAVRLVAGVVLVVPFGVSGALLATVLAEVAALLVAAVPLRRPAAGAEPGTGLRLGSVAHAGFAVTGLFLFSTVDLLLARHHLPEHGSGSYVAAATIAKTVLALPAALMSVVFPRLLLAWARPGRGRALAVGGAMVSGPAMLGAAAIVAVPALVLHLLYGDGYADATGLVRALAGVAALTSLVTVLTYAGLARRSRTIVIPWAGAAVEVALIEVWHGSATQIAVCSAAALVPTLLLLAVLEGRAWRRPRPATTQVDASATDPAGTAAPAGRSAEVVRAHPGAELA
ncbi:lipopolysaccharide biosynthesis protein [Jidongwangia harbinensis]|uniref:lipopolysaccharide biosynthesis protein n=1 Tax=Jidongwangia harbinensis TaxID=2878561 RepID=UPI001CDA39F1|nr:polysaccharide biosynthesis protein [Jidongwangia harbinensis]MCA2213963.1 polysaccharide biosynthesis protein [Jidongwangia harbinensis]